MAELMVWGPNAREVAVAIAGVRHGMAACDGGWWRLNEPSLVHGVDYAFYLEGAGPLPDPRSPWQPEGVHGPSRWIDHERFNWTDARFQPPPLASALIYELHVGTFTPEGTFAAAGERLDHLAGLGVTHIEFMPVAEFAGTRGWGYDGVDLYAPHHAYGEPEDLKRLIDKCHARGLAVLLDVVYNHLGPTGNYLGKFGPYFTHRYRTPWGEAVNFDGRGSREVRRHFIDNALMWLRDYHFDGLRLDAVHAMLDMSAIHFLEQLSHEVRELAGALGRHLVLIAESDLNDPRIVRAVESGGYGLDAQWNEDFHHALHALLTGEREGYYADFGRVADLAEVMAKAFTYDGRYSTYRGRAHGRPVAPLGAHSFVGCLQNHDQVGNRARGDRTSQMLSPGQLKVGAAIVLLSPFIPMIFQGEEWGAASPFLFFTDHEDANLAAAVRNGRREEFAAFGWDPEAVPDPQACDSFERSRLDWDERGRAPHAELMAWHRSLIDLRRREPDFHHGEFAATHVEFDETARWLRFQCGRFIIACNFAEHEAAIPCAERTRPVLLSTPDISINADSIGLPPHAVAIVRIESQP